jgi:hypothetical protein
VTPDRQKGFTFSGHVERESEKALLITPRLNLPTRSAWFPRSQVHTLGYDSSGHFQLFSIPRWLASRVGFASDIVEDGGERTHPNRSAD